MLLLGNSFSSKEKQCSENFRFGAFHDIRLLYDSTMSVMLLLGGFFHPKKSNAPTKFRIQLRFGGNSMMSCKHDVGKRFFHASHLLRIVHSFNLLLRVFIRFSFIVKNVYTLMLILMYKLSNYFIVFYCTYITSK